MRKEMLYSIVLLFAMTTTNVFAQTTKGNFIVAKQQLENMLSGKDSLSYEKAIYLIEHAYDGDKTTYQDFQRTISFYTESIERIIEAQKIQPEYKPENFYQKVRQLSDEYLKDFTRAKTNFGIFTFMTDTTFFRLDSNVIMYNLPYGYSTADPMGTSDWHNTQVINLLEHGSGNCFALSSLFKIFADRLYSDATLCTAPNHIYIRHLDEKGTRYNIDLSSGTFPGVGTLQTLTYTTKEAIQNDISLRKLTTQQAIGLCVVYLAKGYQYKFDVKDNFMLECAETALKYDSLNLNAMLLKAEYLEHVIKLQNKTIGQLQTDTNFKQYEKLLAHLYELGYREMPLDMKNVLVHGWKKDTTMLYLQNHELVKKGETRKWTLSNGLFDEEHAYKPIEQYSQTLFNCKTKKIQGFAKEKPLYNDYNFDPVAFAMNVDPLAHKYAGQSPYIFANNSPIAGIDRDGLEFYFTADGALLGKYGKSNEIRVVQSWYVAQAQQVITANSGNENSYNPYSMINAFSSPVTNASLIEAGKVYQTIYNREIKGKANGVYAMDAKFQSGSGEIYDNTSLSGNTNKNGIIKINVNNEQRGKLLNSDYYNVASTLLHEDFHVNGYSDDNFVHFEIEKRVIASPNYKNTTTEFKENTKLLMESYINMQASEVSQIALDIKANSNTAFTKEYLSEKYTKYKDNVDFYNKTFNEKKSKIQVSTK